MALDGAFLRHIKKELEEKLIDGRVDKIYQPNRDELVVGVRTREGSYKLLLSARANSPRVNLMESQLENPKQPPMFCMLMRKKLASARLVAIRQPELERVIHFDFDAVNELGDRTVLTLTSEIMGKYSNVILTDSDGKIIDALKRVDAEMSSQRLIQPNMQYELPPAQDKLSIEETTSHDLIEKIKEIPKNTELSKAILSTLQGVSPVVCRELEYQIGRGKELYTKEMDDEQYFRLGFFFQKLKETIAETSGKPYMLVNKEKKPIDFSFMDVYQYGSKATVKELDTFSELLESFYHERDTMERMKVREHDLLKLLSNVSERLSRKINNQKAELEESGKRDDLKVIADLLSANMYNIPKGASKVRLLNFYDENQAEIEIKLDPALSAAQNSQKYYKDYRKAKTAEEKLKEQIKIAEDEITYIDSVFEALSLAKTEKDLAEIRAELADEGYIRVIRSKRDKLPKVSEPLKIEISDGFTALVGRNNRQNDKLSMKIAKKSDYWFHTKNIPGSHVVIMTEGKEPTNKALEDAARLAAQHSRAKDSSQVPVDYTQIRNVSKPQGAKPGMVIYVNNKTVYVDPTESIEESE